MKTGILIACAVILVIAVLAWIAWVVIETFIK